MGATANLLLATVFAASASAALLSMLRVFGGDVEAPKLPAAHRRHRLFGWIFAVTYLLLLVSMARKRPGSGMSPLAAGHALLAISLLPLVATKVLIARRWKSLHRLLPGLGIAIAAIAWVVALSGAMTWFGGGGGGDASAAEASLASMPDTPERRAFEQRCGSCHALSRPLLRALAGRTDAAGWKGIVDKMAAKAAAKGLGGWSAEEAAQIVDFLAVKYPALAASGAAPPPSPGGGGEEGDPGDDRGRGRGRGGDRPR